VLPKPPECRGCPLYGDGQGFVPDALVEGAAVLVLGQNPGPDEERGARVTGYAEGGKATYEPCAQAPFLGKTGFELGRVYLPAAGLERGEVSLGNALRCRWIKDGKRVNDPPPEALLRPALEHCTKAHSRIPDSTRLIVASGALAWRACRGPGTVSTWRGYLAPGQGWVGDDPPRQVDVLATLHIADLFRDPRMRRPTRLDYAKVARFLAGSWPQPSPARTGLWDEEWWQRAAKAPFVVIDTEYDPETLYLRLIGLGYPGSAVLQMDTAHTPPHDQQAFRDHLLNLIRQVPVVFQNAVADLPVLEAAFGYRYSHYRQVEDTMQAHAVLWSEWPHDLEFLASIYSPHGKTKHLAGANLHAYNAGDVADTIAVWQTLSVELERDPASARIYHEQSLRLIPSIIYRQKQGILLDPDKVAAKQSAYAAEAQEAALLAQAYCGWPINVGSNKQVGEWLYGLEGMGVVKGKKTRKPTIEADAIATLRGRVDPAPDLDEEEREGLTLAQAMARVDAGAHPLLEARVVYAAALQVESHYLRPLVGQNRCYPRITIHAQASGRFSITDPPLQQFPSDLLSVLRPDPGYGWFGWDWDAAEPHILMAESGSKVLQEVFDKGWDLHTLNACEGFGLPRPPDLTNPHTALENTIWRLSVGWLGKEDPRRLFAKRLYLRGNYGGDPRGAGDIPGARALGLDAAKLVRVAQRIKAVDPELAEWQRRVAEAARRTKESRTFMGRLRRLLGSGREVERQAMDHPMQGGVSDIHNTVVVQVADQYHPDTCSYLYSRHDSIVFEVMLECWDEVTARLRQLALQPWRINGRDVVILATFKETR